MASLDSRAPTWQNAARPAAGACWAVECPSGHPPRVGAPLEPCTWAGVHVPCGRADLEKSALGPAKPTPSQRARTSALLQLQQGLDGINKTRNASDLR